MDVQYAGEFQFFWSSRNEKCGISDIASSELTRRNAKNHIIFDESDKKRKLIEIENFEYQRTVLRLEQN